MTALDTTLQICELLEAILLYLPPSQITQAMRTSKNWHSLIQNSIRLEQRRILRTQPSLVPNAHHAGEWDPEYEPGEKIRVHPIFYYESFAVLNRHNKVHFAFQLDSSSGAEVMHEFACLPPVQKIWLERRSNIYCVLYVKGGIRIKDIVEIGQAMSDGPEDIFPIIGEFVEEEAIDTEDVEPPADAPQEQEGEVESE